MLSPCSSSRSIFLLWCIFLGKRRVHAESSSTPFPTAGQFVPIAPMLSRKAKLLNQSSTHHHMLRCSILLVAMFAQVGAFATFSRQLAFRSTSRHPIHRLSVLLDRDADFEEMMIGGERYSMVPLPDSMVDTTLFVGNLCEFVHDQDLSALFQTVSALHYVPACVARKPNMASMQYGFVSFPNAKEMEAAILRFQNFEWKGRKIKVEPIRDDPKNGRVRVPERLVSYVSGEAKKTRDGRRNELRRISRDDVVRLSKGQPSKKRGYGSRNVPHRLNEEEQAEMFRAGQRGYLTLTGGGNRRTRKGSPLANIHRQWCDAREKPQIVLYKAMGGDATDQVLVDLSPLRLNGLFEDARQVEAFLVKWKAEILSAAVSTGMEFRGNIMEDDKEDEVTEFVVTVDVSTEAWATKPIWQLPVVSMGVFEGERSRAKAMAKELASLWNIPEKEIKVSEGPASRRAAGARQGGRTKTVGLAEHRKRGGGHRQAW